jgi:mRNA interferase RelE/StbE
VAWTYQVLDDADRAIERLGPSARSAIAAWLEKRIHGSVNPEQFGKPLRGSKHGLWRYRVQDWRIICRLQRDAHIVVVVAVGPRSAIYGR